MIDFFEFSNEMLCLADSRGYFTRVNPAWTRTLGWSADELTSRPYMDFVHPDDVQATTREAHLLVEGTHETVWFENRYRCRDGSYRWLSWQAKTIVETGQIVAAARDVTTQKMQAEALREADERFHAFMNHSPALAWAKDEQGRIVYINKACEDRFHVRLADWQGKTDFDLWPREVAERLCENDRKVLAEGGPITVIEHAAAAGGPDSYWMDIKFPFRDRFGRKHVGGIGIEITELKRAEEDLKAKQDLLRNLIEVQENERQMLCNEFHDGLIQYAVGSLMLLESYLRKHRQTEDLSMIEDAVANLRKGIEDGRRVLRGVRPAVLDDSGLRAAIDDLIDQFSSSGITVTFECDPQIGRLPELVQTTVYRVIQEALSNAKKHSGTEAVRIDLKLAGGELQLEIRDFGCGFDVCSARKRGFGLRGMVERVRLIGGECTIESAPGAGTRVAVRLPIAASADCP